MTVPTRLAGWGLATGAQVTWTVAEGRKGRRWREVVLRDGAFVHALLLETDPERRFSHLELARADGLWTFHPESDGTLHGNHVRAGRADAVRHVVGWAFGPGDVLVVDGSPLSLAAVAWRLAADGVAEGTPQDLAGVVIASDPGELEPRSRIRVERLSATRWQVGEWPPFDIDDAGIPALDGGVREPLELG